MKLLLLCLILFFGEQEKKSVTGKYFSDGIFSESIELFADNSFCYNYVGDNMHYNLEGSYSIEDNRLILSKYPCWERFTFSEEKETWKHDVMKDTALIVLRGELSKDGVNNYFTGFHLFLIFDENRIIPFNYHYEKQDYLNQKRSKKKHKASLCFGTTIFPRDRFIGFYMIYYLDGSSMEGILSPTYYVKD
ncbi:hypothetical protein LJB94_01880, partial [Odoribacter sp. OttesenSCG-928-G04]|nr:hypothetical protein [Odoribacter sp. OttesenSCG-928-G04]